MYTTYIGILGIFEMKDIAVFGVNPGRTQNRKFGTKPLRFPLFALTDYY
jgi:hypothetical protein